MARTPNTVSIKLHDLMLLWSYRWAAVNCKIGELGPETHSEIFDAIDRQSKIEIRPAQLADLIFHMQQVMFERIEPAKLVFTMKNHNKMMRKLKSQNPELFKVNKAGEIVMKELEEKAFE